MNPEELVRQGMIELLLEAGLSYDLIDVEVPMSSFAKGRPGRADLIVYGHTKGERKVLLLIECKAHAISLTDNVLAQAFQYNAIVNSPYVAVVNGYDLHFYTQVSGQYTQVEFNSIIEFVANHNTYTEPSAEEWYRLDIKEIEDEKFLETANDFFTMAPRYPRRHYLLDVYSQNWVKSLSLKLENVFYDTSDANRFESLSSKTSKLIEDKGIRFGKYSTFGGYTFTEMYRFLVLEDEAGNFFTVNFAIFSYDVYDYETEETYESSHRGCYMMVGFDNPEISCHSLEYKLDHHVMKEPGRLSFWHDGRITITRRRKNSLVIDYLKGHQPRLVVENKVFLGSLSDNKSLYSNDPEVILLISNIIDYAVYRERLKAEIRQNERDG
jgi:hypothetical protein